MEFGLDPAGPRCRAISLCGEDKRLTGQTGSSGFITTINSTAVETIAAQLRGGFGQIVLPADLEFPPHVQIIHIREGEFVTEAKLFGELFRRPLQSLSLNDRYLRSDHHEQRLRAYLQLIVAEPGLCPIIQIATLAAEINAVQSPYYYQTSAEQQQMFARLRRDFPGLDVQYQLAQRLPHDRFLHLQRTDGTAARIGIGAGLDFIRYHGRAKMTDILIEDPYA